jgi:uracil-DNA glycosylase
MEVKIEKGWKDALADEFQKPYFEELSKKIKAEYVSHKIYPPPAFIFNAFNLSPFNEVRVVILGQDPYHGDGQAHGLSFSVPDGVSTPPSLQNIYKEIHTDLGLPIPQTGNLEHWAKQGVLLLNATLTVQANSPTSHKGFGWEQFTDAVIKTLSDKKEHLVFLLWGRFAQDKASLIDTKKHLVLTAAHPSPFSAYNGFFGCKHFSKTNTYLTSVGKKPIQWTL